MLDEISKHFREKLKVFFLTDNLILNNKVIPIHQDNFKEIVPATEVKTIAFVDGGQAELFSGGSLHLSFIRVFAQVMQGKQKLEAMMKEFYVFTSAAYRNGEVWYQGKIFSQEESFIDEVDLVLSSHDSSLQSGRERGPISKVAEVARRLAELKLASTVQADLALLDGSLEKSFPGEEKYISSQVSSLAKTCSLFTTNGNNPAVLLQKLSPLQGSWSYSIGGDSYFVKLHPQAKHIFRFQGRSELLPHLLLQGSDALFLGYPYGLIWADKMARVSKAEKNSLQAKLLLRPENREMASYLRTMNAHEILDGITQL